MNDTILKGITIPPHEEYVRICETSLSNDLDHIYNEAHLVGVTLDTEYNDAKKIIIREVDIMVKSHIMCESAPDNDIADGENSVILTRGACVSCENRESALIAIKKLRDRKTISRRYDDPVYTEFWTSYYPIVERNVSPCIKPRSDGKFQKK